VARLGPDRARGRAAGPPVDDRLVELDLLRVAEGVVLALPLELGELGPSLEEVAVNRALALRKKRYAAGGKHLSYANLCKHLTACKAEPRRTNRYAWTRSTGRG
jgi:hypothetical protein